jgi:signal transduction histidine kinase
MRSLDEECPLAHLLAERVRANRATLVQRWLERIAARNDSNGNAMTASEDVLGHVSPLIDGIADYLEHPETKITSELPIVAKAREVGALRHEQGFDANEILMEYEILGNILFSFAVEELERSEWPVQHVELLVCAQRLFRGVAIVQQSTMTHFLDLANERVREREQRLRTFNRSITHELKNRIGAVLGAADLLLTLDRLGDAERARFASIVARNAREMQTTLESLIDLSRLDGDARQQRHVALAEAVREVLRRLRDTVSSGGVQVSVSGTLPDVQVNAAAVVVALTNYVSNAVKYADASKQQRWVRIEGRIEAGDGTDVVLRVRDNGIGVAPAARPHLFERFFRADSGSAKRVEGTGLGLNIVRETIEAMGGRVWAEFPEEGSVFAFAIPCRRGEDRARVGSRRELPTDEMRASR